MMYVFSLIILIAFCKNAYFAAIQYKAPNELHMYEVNSSFYFDRIETDGCLRFASIEVHCC